MPDDDKKLYGTVGAEVLYTDPAGAYESLIEPWRDEQDREPHELEEWSSLPAVHHVPSAVNIVEHVCELIADDGEIDESCYDQWRKTLTDPDVLAAAEALRVAMASKITYRMADKHLRSLWVTWDDAGEPLLDGVPMYVKASDG